MSFSNHFIWGTFPWVTPWFAAPFLWNTPLVFFWERIHRMLTFFFFFVNFGHPGILKKKKSLKLFRLVHRKHFSLEFWRHLPHCLPKVPLLLLGILKPVIVRRRILKCGMRMHGHAVSLPCSLSPSPSPHISPSVPPLSPSLLLGASFCPQCS